MNEPGPVTSDDGRAAGAVFVSYATADRKQALSVCKAIERRGTHCWISCRDVAPGENYQEEIVHSIRQARAMVLVFSQAANNSDEIKKELSLASRYHVPVMALRIEDVEPSDAFAYELSTRQWIDAFEGWDHSIDALVTKLEQVSGAKTSASIGEAAATTQHRPARIGEMTRRWLMTSAIILLLAVAASAAYFWNPFAKAEPLTVQVADFAAVGIPAETGTAFKQALSDSVGDESTVQIKEKDATYRLSGTITNLGGKIDYAARLTDPRSERVLWSANRAFDAAGGAAGPQQAAASVSWIIQCGLGNAMESPTPLSARALSLYLQHCQQDLWGDAGLRWPLQVKSDKSAYGRRLDLARQLVVEAPNFSRSWSLLARDASAAATLTTPFGSSPQLAATLRATAKDAVNRALKLDPRNGNAYLSAAYLVPWRNWTQREAMHKRSIELRDSHCGCEHEQYALLLLRLGRPSEAIIEAQRALDMQPNSPSALDLLAMSYYATGDVGDGDRVVANRTAFWKDSTGSKNMILYQAIETKRWAQAAAVAKELFDQPTEVPLAEAFAAFASGSRERISAARSAVVAMPADLAVVQPRISFLAAIGDAKDALAILTPLALKREPAMEYILDPQIASLRADVAWVEVVRTRGVIDYWHTSHKPPEFCKAADAPPFCKTL